MAASMRGQRPKSNRKTTLHQASTCNMLFVFFISTNAVGIQMVGRILRGFSFRGVDPCATGALNRLKQPSVWPRTTLTATGLKLSEMSSMKPLSQLSKPTMPAALHAINPSTSRPHFILFTGSLCVFATGSLSLFAAE